MAGLKAGNSQMDILAFHPIDGIRLHVEVQASTDPMGRVRPWKNAKYSKMSLEWRIKAMCNKKFVGNTNKETGEPKDDRVKDVVARAFGTAEYGKAFVLARFKGDSYHDLKAEFARHGVEVVLLETVLKELIDLTRDSVYMDAPRRYMQLFSRTLSIGGEVQQVTGENARRLGRV